MTFVENEKTDVGERFGSKGEHGKAAFGGHNFDFLELRLGLEQEIKITGHYRTENILGEHFLKIIRELLDKSMGRSQEYNFLITRQHTRYF
jgi:hypothetical protein